MAERDVRGDVHVQIDALRDARGRAHDQALRPLVAIGTHKKCAHVGEWREARAHAQLLLEMCAQPLLLGAEGVALGARPSGDHFGSHTRRPSSRYSRSVKRSLSLGSVAARSRKMSDASGSPTNPASTARPSSTIDVTESSRSQPRIMSAK